VLLGIIVACEIGFWLLIVLGLTARYLMRRPRLGMVLLAMTPIVDLILLVAAGLDLRNGGDATFAHSLAAIYLGFSVAYGHRMIRWADVRFAHRFAGGPAPVKLYGRAYAAACWRDVPRTALALGIAAGVLWLLTLVAAEEADLEALVGTYRILGIILAIELIWAASYTIWPKPGPAGPVPMTHAIATAPAPREPASGRAATPTARATTKIPESR
jgi:hypothetical protein